MASNFECVGISVDSQEQLGSLLDDVLPAAVFLGEAGGARTLRWEDPSGARLAVTLRGNQVVSLVPSWRSETEVTLRSVIRLNEDTFSAGVFDGDEQLTAMAFELEQRHVTTGQGPWSMTVQLVALGQAVTVHRDADAFATSDNSLLGGGDSSAEPPADFAAQGWPWPPRMAAESFISYGAFGDPAHAQATARLSGTVLSAAISTVAHSGRPVVTALVHSAGFDVTVCLSGAEHPQEPAAGSVLSGEVFLVASAAHTKPQRAGWRQRLRLA